MSRTSVTRMEKFGREAVEEIHLLRHLIWW
jgi:hypothetical protein